MTIVEAFGQVVKAAEAVVLPRLKQYDASIQHLHYEYGHPKAILKIMQAWSTSTQPIQAKMYPLVALFQDFTESQPAKAGQLETVALRVVIANRTLAEYDTPQRYAKNFEPVLRPIYTELIKQLQFSPLFQGISRPKHEHYDRPFWGTEGLYGSEKNIFNGEMDVIEIRNLELTPRLQPVCGSIGMKTNSTTT